MDYNPKPYVEDHGHNIDIKFHATNLMGKKPAINPYDIFDDPTGKRYRSGGGLNISTEANTINPYDFTRLDLPSDTASTPKDQVIEQSKLPPEYKNFKPKFSAISKIVTDTPTTSDFSSFENILEDEVSDQNDRLKQLMDHMNQLRYQKPEKLPIKVDKFEELERLRDLYDDSNRQFDLMRKHRGAYDKLFRMRADEAVALVKSSRIPARKDIEYAMRKYGGGMGGRGGSERSERRSTLGRTGQMSVDNLRPQVVVKRKKGRRRRPSTSSSELSSSSSEEEPGGVDMAEIERRAQEIVNRKLQGINLAPRLPPNPPQMPQPQNGSNIVKLPNGMTLVRSNDPAQPPLILAPEKGGSESSSRLSSVRTEDRWNPMNEYVNNMMTLKLMKMMEEDDKRSELKGDQGEMDELDKTVLESVKSSRKSVKKSKTKSKKSSKKPKKKKKKRKKTEPKTFSLSLEDPPNSLNTFGTRNDTVEPIEEEPQEEDKEDEKEPEEPKEEQDSDPKPVDHYPSAMKKVWKLRIMLYFFRHKFNVKLKLIKKEKIKFDEYFQEKAPEIDEQAYYMLRSRIGGIIDAVVKDEKLSLDVSSERVPNVKGNLIKLKAILDAMITELDHMTEMREHDNFDNPQVLKMLAKYTLPNCFIPNERLFKVEIDKLIYTVTGKTEPKMLQKASEMLIGSFLIINILIKKMLLDADLTFNNGKPLQDNQYKNLRVIAACFYHAYNDKYKGINWNLNSTQTIEYVEPPVPKTTPILFDKDSKPESNVVISGVPKKSEYIVFFSDQKYYLEFSKKLRNLIFNLEEQVRFEKDTENLKLYKRRIGLRKDVASTIKKNYPRLSKKYQKYVIDRQKELFLID